MRPMIPPGNIPACARHRLGHFIRKEDFVRDACGHDGSGGGIALAFLLMLAVVVVWPLLGPHLHYSDT